MVVCASTNVCSIEPNPAAVLATSLYGARCCSDVKIDGFKKAPATCGNLWVSAIDSDNQCMMGVTFDYAKDVCAGQGARLCTKREYLDNCTNKAKSETCNVNAELVWSSSDN